MTKRAQMFTRGSTLQKILVISQSFFFFSGATSLVYQVLWTRRLSLTFGHTVLAVSTVLTAFMAGLALGSVGAGWWTDRQPKERHPALFLRDYGILEGFIGVWALLSLGLLSLVEKVYVAVASGGTSGLPLYGVCFVGAAVVLVPPTTAMGATVPILARLLTHQPGEVGRILSRLYGLNTLGALLGAALSGFVLLPAIGLTAAMVLCAVVNFAIAGGAVSKSRQFAGMPIASAEQPKESGSKAKAKKTKKKGKKKKGKAKKEKEPQQPAEPKSETQEAGPRGPVWIIPATFALAGAASMGYQIAWNRSICLAIGSSIYAFSTILVTFLGGLGMGSLLYPLIIKDRKPRLAYLGWLYLGIALSGAGTELLLPMLPKWFLALFPLIGESYLGVIVLNLVLSGGVLLLPTLLMGLGFPLATAIYSDSLSELGRDVGRVYGANTVGCIVGSFATGFALVPTIGAQWSLKVATLVYLTGAVTVLLLSSSAHSRRGAVAATLLALSVCFVFPRWDKGVFSAGVAIYAGTFGGVVPKDAFTPPAAYFDGLSSNVSFHLAGENYDNPRMKVNGKVDASYGPGDRLTQYMLGYLPTLMHPAPKRVGVIGLGGGFTVEAVTQCPGVEAIEVAELEPAVVRVGDFWRPYNGRAQDDPRTHLHITDGRTFVLATPEKFDVLISEPSNPWIAGIGNLFTRDFYAIAKGRLNDDGVMCQWFNLYAVSTEDMKMVIRGFYEVFPHGHLWQTNAGDLIMLGGSRPLEFEQERYQAAWQNSETIQRHFFESQILDPAAVPGLYLMDREQALEMVGEGPYNTDDRPLLEFSAPFSLYRREAHDTNREVLKGVGPRSFPPGLELSEAIRRRSLFAAMAVGDIEHLRAELKRYGRSHPDGFVLAAKLKARLDKGSIESQRAIYRGCLSAFPKESGLASFEWAELEYGARNFEKAAELCLTALADPPPGSEAYLCQLLGKSLLHLEHVDKALAPLGRSARLAPARSTALALQGGALVAMSRDQEALTVLDEALERNPYDPFALEQRGYAHFNVGETEAAERDLLRFLELIPYHPDVWSRLGVCRKALGDIAGAREAFSQALYLNPSHPGANEELQKL